MDFTLFIYDVADYKDFPDMIWVRDDVEAEIPNTGTLDLDNQVDCYKLRLGAGESYNLSLTATGADSEECRISVFNHTQQITNNGEALWTYDTKTNNGSHFQIWTENQATDFFIVIENLEYGATYDYTLEHIICPLTAELQSPNNAEYINLAQVTFEWELDDPKFDSTDIDRCILEIWDESNNLKYSTEYDNDATLDGDNSSISIYIFDYILGKPSVNNTHKLSTDGHYYWQVKFVSNNYQWSKGFLRLFNLDTTNPSVPELYEPDQTDYSRTGDYTVNWSVADDGPVFEIDYYKVYRGKTEDFVCDDYSLLTISPWRKTEYKEYDMKTETYYYKVIAVDHVGLESLESESARYIVSIGGYVEPFDQDFVVLAGDYVEYQFVDVIDGDLKDPNDLYAEFKGRTFQMNTIIHFWLSQVSADSIIPVRGNFYMKWMNTTAEQLEEGFLLIENNVDMFPLIVSTDTHYQRKIFELFCNRTFTNSTFEHKKSNTWYFDQFSAIDVVVHTFYKNVNYEADIFQNDMAIFVVDARTGVVIEFTFYDDRAEKGFSLKLINTNIGLSRFYWWLIPLIIVSVLGIIAAIINGIVKKLEKRV